MKTVKEAKLISIGVEVLVAYLLANEVAVRNLRILLAGKTEGLSKERILERIRESYV